MECAGDYDGALAVVDEIVSVAQGAPQPTVGCFRDLLHRWASDGRTSLTVTTTSSSPSNTMVPFPSSRCEVTQVLLLLLLQPTPQRLPARLAHLLERYTWGEHADGAGECSVRWRCSLWRRQARSARLRWSALGCRPCPRAPLYFWAHIRHRLVRCNVRLCTSILHGAHQLFLSVFRWAG